MALDLAQVPWSLVMAVASLAIIYGLFRARPDVFEDFGFGGKEVALLALGSVAGGAANVTLWVFGGTYLALNVGGTIVPILLVAWWIKKGKLRLLPALVGIALVSYTAWKIVEFRPDTGIVARYPTFFLPVVVAFLFALVVSLHRPVSGIPIAYASGSLGALIGADIMNIHHIGAHFASARDNTVISIGGAGVFDMVFLAGTFAMAILLAIVCAIRPRPQAPEEAPREYPGVPLTLRDSRRVHESYRALQSPNPLERAVEGLALSNLALREGDHARSIRMSWLAVDALLKETKGEIPELAQSDAMRLQEQYFATRGAEPTLADAGNANLAAKHLVAALAPRAGLRHTLEGIA